MVVACSSDDDASPSTTTDTTVHAHTVSAEACGAFAELSALTFQMPEDPNEFASFFSEQMVPVVTTITNQLVLAVNPKVVPVDDFPGFVDFVRNSRSPLFYASIGSGSQHHLAMEMLKQRFIGGPRLIA